MSVLESGPTEETETRRVVLSGILRGRASWTWIHMEAGRLWTFCYV